MLGRIQSTASVLFGVLLVIAAIFSWKKAAQEGEYSDARFVFCLGGMFACLIGVLVAFCSVGNFFAAWFAPKVWLVQELARLAK